jgi:hypothetical protein
MDNQLDTVQELNLNDEILRDLIATEIMLVGGGDIAQAFC